MGKLGRFPGEVPKRLRLEDLQLPEPPDAASWPPLPSGDTVGDSTTACIAHLIEQWERLPRPD